jgi:hypothetical protein
MFQEVKTMRDMYDELEPLTDAAIDKMLGQSSEGAETLGAALKSATPKELARALAFLNQAYEKWLSTTEELSIVAKALKEFHKKNFSHPAIYRYLSDKMDQIFA